MGDFDATRNQIFGIGTVVIDHVVTLDRYPERDTKSAIVSHWRQIGGPVPVALSTAAFYGSKTHFAGRWGNDVAGDEIRNGLTNRGINLAPSSSSDDWSTGFAHVWTEATDGTRTIAFSRGEFPQPTTDELAPHFPLLDQCTLLHLDGASPVIALAAAKRMKQNGGTVLLDAGSKKPGMAELLPYVDIIIASDLFCKSWFGKTVSEAAVLSLGPKAVVRTRGAEGAVYTDAERVIETAGIPIEAIDTNGAGDIFSGAFLFGYACGWEIERSMGFACFVAGNSCRHFGNSTLPNGTEFR